MMESRFELDDAVVLLLGASTKFPNLRNRLDGITRLEKLIFLLEHESLVGQLFTERPDFRAHHFGPFSEGVYHAVEILETAGLIKETAKLATNPEDSWEYANIVGDEAPYAMRQFELTERGKRYYDALVKELPKKVLSDAEKLKDRFGPLPLKQLIRYVYKRYPRFTERSKIREEILSE